MPTPHSHEPWKVREYNLAQKPYIQEDKGRTYLWQSWDIIADSEREVARVLWSAGHESCAWGAVLDKRLAEANRDRIVACVNACAGMADPAAEIAQLRAKIATSDEARRTAEQFLRLANQQNSELQARVQALETAAEHARVGW